MALFVCLFIYLFVCLFICLFVCLLVCLLFQVQSDQLPNESVCGTHLCQLCANPHASWAGEVGNWQYKSLWQALVVDRQTDRQTDKGKKNFVWHIVYKQSQWD